MKPAEVPARLPGVAARRRRRVLPFLTLCLVAGVALGQVGILPVSPQPRPTAAPRTSEDGVRWQKLKPAQRDALRPLQSEWDHLDAPSRQKWVQLADRLSSMPPEERARIQGRMAEWARLTPAERGQARLRYQEAKQVPASDRRSRWDAYQALPPEEKHELAARAAAARPAREAVEPRRSTTPVNGRGERPARDGPQAKSNIVPNPAYAAPPRPIGPTVVQAAPGATTTLITRRPSPPPHQQVGLPKIAATPEFVNKSTLLPQRGPQGAAIRPVNEAGSGPSRR